MTPSGGITTVRNSAEKWARTSASVRAATVLPVRSDAMTLVLLGRDGVRGQTIWEGRRRYESGARTMAVR
jgi:hypothetical protein